MEVLAVLTFAVSLLNLCAMGIMIILVALLILTLRELRETMAQVTRMLDLLLTRQKEQING